MGPGDASELGQAIADGAGLDQVAGIIARCDPSAPPVEKLSFVLDELASGVSDPSSSSLLRHVFSTLGFAGNMNRYFHPANSLLHRVLERRMGNPLLLSVVAAELSRRAGGTLEVVGFPGHVLLGDNKHPTRWFDPFLSGAGMDLAGCRILLARMRPGEAFHPSMVRPASSTEIAQRMLNNLDVAFRQSGEIACLAMVAELRLGIPGAGNGQRRQLAHTLVAAGRVFRAADVLAELVESDPPNGDEYRVIRHRLLAQRN